MTSFFECLKKLDLKIKPSKCQLLVEKAGLLGNYVPDEARTINEQFITRSGTFRLPKDGTELEANFIA